MISFEEIVCEKDKEKRDLLIKEKLFELNETSPKVTIDTNSIMTGFISKESTVMFSAFHYDLNMGLGSLYGMREDDYFYEFFDFLNAHNITTKEQAIMFISSFLKLYFDEQGKKEVDRELLFDDICNQLDNMSDDVERFNRCKESWLDIGIFKNRSAAECTEHSCVAQNLLTFCDVDCCYVSGHMKTNTSNEDHAYNIIKLNDKYYLLDSTNPYNLYDSNDNYAGCKSYFFEVSKEQLENLFKNKGEIVFPKCNFMKTPNGTTIKVDQSTNVYTTSCKFLDKDSMNEFLESDNKKL